MPPSFYTLLMPISFFIFGLILGSYFNVLIWRMPRKESTIKPSSHCTSCNQQIKWYDNIPLFSFIILRGKCRSCGAKISWRYPAIELLSGLLFISVWHGFGLSWFTPFVLYYVSSMLVMSVIDIEHFILPNRFTLSLIPLGFISTFLRTDLDWKDSLIGIAVGGGLIFLFSGGYRLLRGKWGMGGGDIKLMAGIGAYLGPRMAIIALLIGTFSGVIVSIPVLLKRKKGLGEMLPFGPFLCLGGIVALFFGEEIFDWWIRHPLIDFSVD